MAEPFSLEDIFNTYVGQESLEQAAVHLAADAKCWPELYKQISVALAAGATSMDEGRIVKAVELSGGYYAHSAAMARRVISQLRSLFEDAYASGA